MTARQVVKMQTEIISSLYKQAEQVAKATIPDLQAQAQVRFSEKLDNEIQRLKALQLVNPSIRDDEISALEEQLTQGLEYLNHVHIVSDAVRIVIAG
jgi:ATP-dependent helicase HepA